VRLDGDVRVEVPDPVAGRVQLGPTDIAGAMDDLPLQVAGVDPVEIHQSQATDSRRRQVQAER